MGLIGQIFNLQRVKPDNPFYINESSDFSNLEIKSTDKPEFWYFYDKTNSCYVTSFVLTDQPVVQRRCDVVLIKNSAGFFEPRFSFYIWNKNKNEKIKEIKNFDKLEKIGSIKSLVSLESEGSKNFWKLIAFLTNIKSVLLSDFNKYKIFKSDEEIINILESKEKENIIEILSKISKEKNFTNKDIEIILDRKTSLNVFKKFIEEEEYWKIYNTENKITDDKEEKALQHFLKDNEWIFGYGLDYRFITIFDTECSVGDADISDKDKPKIDFLSTFHNFTVLVEIKKPKTEFFDSSKNRSGCWKLSDEFIDSVSQCLEQKSAWQIKGNREHISKDGQKKLEKSTKDPKMILLLGNIKEQIDKIGDLREKELKQKTLELFRRDSRNIEIITYDELYERAYYIVHDKYIENK